MNEIRAAREILGLSTMKLAALLRVSLRTYQRWENGTKHCPPGVIEHIKLLMKISTNGNNGEYKMSFATYGDLVAHVEDLLGQDGSRELAVALIKYMDWDYEELDKEEFPDFTVEDLEAANDNLLREKLAEAIDFVFEFDALNPDRKDEYSPKTYEEFVFTLHNICQDFALDENNSIIPREQAYKIIALTPEERTFIWSEYQRLID